MRSPTQLLKDSMAIVRGNPSLFLGITLIPMVISYVASLFAPAENTGVVMAEEWVIFLPLMLVVMVTSILMTVALALALNNQSVSVGDAYKQSLKYFWRYIGLSILMSIILMVGFLLLIVPGLIMSVWFAFATFVLVLEGAGIVDSLKRSREYVRGRWWGVFGRLAVMTVVAFLISIVGAVIASMLPELLGGILETAVSIITVPFLVGYTYLMYQDVKGGAAPVAA